MMKNKGFTLIELSIVLIIVALIVSGVVGGQALVKQAELKSVITYIQSIKTAINTFNLQFDQIPGDFDLADKYWNGAIDNGNKDGQVLWDGEHLDFWEHLTLAGVMPGNFEGSNGGNWMTPLTNLNSPFAKMDGGTYGFIQPNVIAGIIFGPAQATEHALSFGKIALGWTNTGGILSVSEAVAIDTKLDDGIANVGKILAGNHRGLAGNCMNLPNGDDYNKSLPGNGCVMAFLVGF